MASNGIKINEDAFKVSLSHSITDMHMANFKKVVSGTFFGLAIMAAITRSLTRFRTAPKYTLDDALLLFACICLITATALLFKLIPRVYLDEELDFKGVISQPFPVSDITKELVLATRLRHTYTFTSWLVVFAAKFCFLSFFRALIDRVRHLIIYWRIVVVITFIFGGFACCETFIACPRIGASSCETLRMLQIAPFS